MCEITVLDLQVRDSCVRAGRYTLLVPSFIVNQKDDEPGLAEMFFILDDCLQDFPDIQALRNEQEICLVNLAHLKDVLQFFQLVLEKV